jgi:hypothetical protein
MTRILDQVQSQLLPELEPFGLRLLRHHGSGMSEVVDLVFGDVRINLYCEKAFYEVDFGPASDASWFPARKVSSYLGFQEREFASASLDKTIAQLKEFLLSSGDQLNKLFSKDGFATAKTDLRRTSPGRDVRRQGG